MDGTVWGPQWLPIRSESQLVKLRAPTARRFAETRPRYVLLECPAAMPLEMIRLVVLRPRWIILVPESTCWRPLEIAIEENSPRELSPRSRQLGYLQEIA